MSSQDRQGQEERKWNTDGRVSVIRTRTETVSVTNVAHRDALGSAEVYDCALPCIGCVTYVRRWCASEFPVGEK
jgi:hypothetical protein